MQVSVLPERGAPDEIPDASAVAESSEPGLLAAGVVGVTGWIVATNCFSCGYSVIVIAIAIVVVLVVVATPTDRRRHHRIAATRSSSNSSQ